MHYDSRLFPGGSDNTTIWWSKVLYAWRPAISLVVSHFGLRCSLVDKLSDVQFIKSIQNN